MKNQIKVKGIEDIKRSDSYHTVTRGVLRFSKPKTENKDNAIFFNLYGWLEPVIVSESEKIDNMDWVYNTDGDKYQIIRPPHAKEYKILSFAENISPEHFKAIGNKEIKDGDLIFVKVEKVCCKSGYIALSCLSDCKDVEYGIRKNHDNHIILFLGNKTANEATVSQERDKKVHLAHCYQGEYESSCKYGEENCPAHIEPNPEFTAAMVNEEIEFLIQDYARRIKNISEIFDNTKFNGGHSDSLKMERLKTKQSEYRTIKSELERIILKQK